MRAAQVGDRDKRDRQMISFFISALGDSIYFQWHLRGRSMFLQLSQVLAAVDAIRLIIRGLGLADGIQIMTFFSRDKSRHMEDIIGRIV